ncbi:TonB-dependent receptor [Phenylobacterium sp.]|uniref:TonB-dependent receptor n=1 Tax=Phenylobacterium sp. TaxID=1871053 RepID=UPI002F419794
MNTKVRLLASGAALLAAALSTSVHAQTAAKPAVAAAAGGATIEELVVTAEKRSQNLQDVPVAISAFTSEKRDLLGITSIQDMTNFTPGLEYTSANDRNSLRGVARLSNAQALSIPVAVYDDGIFTTSTVTAGKAPIFTDRVEVLRGPQGTLYGRNSLGGAINVISKKPTEDPYAEIRATLGNYGYSRLEAAVSGPLAPDLQFRLAGSWEKQRDGYFTNVVPGMPSEGNVIDQYYIEGQLQAKFGDHMDGWIKGYITGWNNGAGGPGARAQYTTGQINLAEFNGGSQNINAGFGCAPGGVVANLVNANPMGCVNPANSDPRKFATNFAQTVSLDDTYGISANLTYHFDSFDVKFMGGLLNYHYTLDSDNTSTLGGAITSFQVPIAPFNPAAPVAAQPCAATNLVAPGACTPITVSPLQFSTYQESYRNFSDEIDFASTGNGPFQWIGGLYYYKQDVAQPVFTTNPGQAALDGVITPAVPAITGPVSGDFQRRLYDDRPETKVESYAAFGQIDWKFTDTLKLTLGARYNHDQETGSEAVRVICYAAAACLNGSAPELLGSFTPPVDVTSFVVWGPTQGAPAPAGVVANGKPGGVTFTPDGFAHRNYDATWDAWTGTAGLQWDPSPGTMMYARYSRGYLMGGFNVGVTSTLGEFPETQPEFDNDYEIGLKKDFFNRTLQVDLALFYEDLRGYQAPLSVVSQSGGLAVSQSEYLNIPRAVSQGVELETNWAPIEHLNILFNYSFDDAKITKLTGIVDPNDPEAQAAGAKPLTALTACASASTPLCDVNTGLVQRAQDLSGNAMPQNARNKVALAVTYAIEFEGGTLTPEASYIWRDKQYSTIFQRSYNESPSWDQTDLRLTWKDKDNRYSIIGYVKNVFDQLGYDGGASATRLTGIYSASTIAALGMTRGLPGNLPGTFNAVQRNASFNGLDVTYPLTPPRTFGVEFQYRF